MLQKELSRSEDLLVENQNYSKHFSGSTRKFQSETSNNSVEAGKGADLLGIGGSLFCLLHCLAPQIVSLGLLGASFGSFFAGEYWAILFWATCFWAVFRSAANAVYLLNKSLLWLAFLIFSSGLIIEFIVPGEKWISYAGSIILISAHLWNFWRQLSWNKFCRNIHQG